MTTKAALFITACAVALLMGGCAHTQTVCLKTVNATNGQPLPGVSVSMMQFDDRYFGTSKSLGPTNLPPSDETGMTKVSAKRSGWVKQFVFSRPGYITAYGDYGTTEGDVFWLGTPKFFNTDPRYRWFGRFFLGNDVEQAVKTNRCFVIRMSPINPKTTPAAASGN